LILIKLAETKDRLMLLKQKTDCYFCDFMKNEQVAPCCNSVEKTRLKLIEIMRVSKR